VHGEPVNHPVLLGAADVTIISSSNANTAPNVPSVQPSAAPMPTMYFRLYSALAGVVSCSPYPLADSGSASLTWGHSAATRLPGYRSRARSSLATSGSFMTGSADSTP
jgi:hypothetical protein